MNTISFIIATTGRPSLQQAIQSVELWAGDELIVIGGVADRTDGQIRYVSCPPGRDWGSTERNRATPLARGAYLAHLDDDDAYMPGTRALMADAIVNAPTRPTLFRMQYGQGGHILWDSPELRRGNVGTPMMLIPNDPDRLGQWGERQDCGDFCFLATMRWTAAEIVWRSEVIAQIGQVHV